VSTRTVVPVVAPAILPAQLPNIALVDQTGRPTQFFLKLLQTLPFGAKTPQVVKSTHAARKNILASSYVDGSLYIETDRQVAYVALSGIWIYLAGFFQSLQANLPDATDLGASDAGLLCWVTDFNHVLRWTGTGWQWAPGELGSDFIVAFVTGPDPQTGWQACDGTSGVARLNSDGSLSAVDVPNTAGSWYRQ